MAKNYHVTRVGISDFPAGNLSQHLLFGVEYDTDYYTGVLLVPVAMELANNIMSQIEKADLTELNSDEVLSALGESPWLAVY